MNSDKLLKILSVLSTFLFIPLAGWIWNTNIQIISLQKDLQDTQKEIVFLKERLHEEEQNSKSIISIEKDIEYMKSTLARIENLVVE